MKKMVKVPPLKKMNKMQDFMIDIRTPNSTRNRDNKAIQRLEIDLVQKIPATKPTLANSPCQDGISDQKEKMNHPEAELKLANSNVEEDMPRPDIVHELYWQLD